MRNVLLLTFLSILSSFVAADYEGSYEYSKYKYPKITEFLNKNNPEGIYSSVNVEMPNDGIFSLGMHKDRELLLVNHITFNVTVINYGSALISRIGDKFEHSSIELPTPYQIKHEGATYSLYKPVSEVKNGTLIVNYAFTCKQPASFASVGDCSDHKIYQTELKYQFKEGKLALIQADIKIQ
ncbi:hypothetical protein R50073_33600 [Maricurvus nonylphenolicus]|uniref:hypothetical protein n=1 Tax=Maricurvus nonylphenolicus TaxID=1008307 RepID=UPI0036F1F460